MIAKERAAGAYRLSAYYLAKSASDLPLQILTPTLSYTFTFWMAGLGGVPEFFATLPVLLLATITAQVNYVKIDICINKGCPSLHSSLLISDNCQCLT